jgi:hypothetical protein
MSNNDDSFENSLIYVYSQPTALEETEAHRCDSLDFEEFED